MKDNCILSCSLGFGLIVAYVVMMLTSKDNIVFQKFLNNLDENQAKIYKGIVAERLHIYLWGLFFGTLFGGIYLVYGSKNNFNICLFLVIVFGFTTLYYYLYPKDKYMLTYLKNNIQVNDWLDIYKFMQRRFLLSFVIGIIGYGLVGYTIVKNKY